MGKQRTRNTKSPALVNLVATARNTTKYSNPQLQPFLALNVINSCGNDAMAAHIDTSAGSEDLYHETDSPTLKILRCLSGIIVTSSSHSYSDVSV